MIKKSNNIIKNTKIGNIDDNFILSNICITDKLDQLNTIKNIIIEN